MPPHLSLDTKKRIVAAFEAGNKAEDVAKMFQVNKRTVLKLKEKSQRPEGVDRKKGSGGQNKVRSPEFKADLEARIAQNPKVSARALSREMKTTHPTILKALKELGFKSYAQPVAQLVTETQRTTRIERCIGLVNQLKRGSTGVIFFTDEKIFTQDIHVNRRNSRVIARSPDERDDHMVFRSKHPASIMVFGLVASDGKKMPLVMFEPRFRLNTDGYLEVLEQVKRWILAEYPAARVPGEEGVINPEFCFTFMQDGAPCHTAVKAQKWLTDNFGESRFWKKTQ